MMGCKRGKREGAHFFFLWRELHGEHQYNKENRRKEKER